MVMPISSVLKISLAVVAVGVDEPGQQGGAYFGHDSLVHNIGDGDH